MKGETIDSACGYSNFLLKCFNYSERMVFCFVLFGILPGINLKNSSLHNEKTFQTVMVNNSTKNINKANSQPSLQSIEHTTCHDLWRYKSRSWLETEQTG
jgi:hypothetical protein